MKKAAIILLTICLSGPAVVIGHGVCPPDSSNIPTYSMGCENVTCGPEQVCIAMNGTVERDTHFRDLGCQSNGNPYYSPFPSAQNTEAHQYADAITGAENLRASNDSCIAYECRPMNNPFPDDSSGIANPALMFIGGAIIGGAIYDVSKEFAKRLGEDVANKQQLQREWNAKGNYGPAPGNNYFMFGLTGN